MNHHISITNYLIFGQLYSSANAPYTFTSSYMLGKLLSNAGNINIVQRLV